MTAAQGSAARDERPPVPTADGEKHQLARGVNVRYLSRPSSGAARRYHVRCTCGALVEASSRVAVIRRFDAHALTPAPSRDTEKETADER